MDRHLVEICRVRAESGVIDRLTRLLGIANGYTDVHQNENVTSEESKRAIIAAFGLDVSSASAARASLAAIEQVRGAMFAPLVTPDSYGTVPIRAAPGTNVEWQVTLEDGSAREGRARVEHHDRGDVLWLDHLPDGYHKLVVRAG